jgi:hypothetical protein
MEGLIEGEICNRNGCKGTIERIDDDTSCSCHIHPPCSHCVDARHECKECGHEIDSPEIEYKSVKTDHTKIDPWQRKSDYELYNELKENEFAYITICGKYYWMEYKGKYPKGMTSQEILGKFNTCFGYKWLRIPQNGEFHLKVYTD